MSIKNFLTQVTIIIAILSPLIILGLWATATIQSCGWRGLFVECRITDCPK